MGFLDELKKLTQPYGFDDPEDFVDEAAREEPPVRPARARTNPFGGYGGEPAPAQGASAPRQSAARPKEGKVVSMGGGGQMQVVVVTPERFEEAAEIADHLRGKRSVLVNMESTDKDTARRLLDFLSGVNYAMDGNIRRVASNTFILTPPTVNVMGDQLDDIGSSGIYF